MQRDLSEDETIQSLVQLKDLRFEQSDSGANQDEERKTGASDKISATVEGTSANLETVPVASQDGAVGSTLGTATPEYAILLS